MKRGETAARAWWLVFVLGSAACAVGGLTLWDVPVLETVRAGGGAEWRGVARWLSRYGDFPWLAGAGMLALAVAWWLGDRNWMRIFAAMLLAGSVAGLASNAIKAGSGRVRPRVEHIGHGWYGTTHEGEWVALTRSDFQSFPSSHAACAFGFFFPLFLSRRGWGSAGIVFAVAVAWSRVQLNAHHVSDVSAGALLGVLAGWFVWLWLVRRGGLERFLGPAPPG